ncbi:MAG TPA: MJ0042-type zinc finger domain-containing protein [Urbifossiella sp.]|nr:MJ0042-type zinc finger domain-containing protein [Urbifossiella sp.]
MNNTCPSCGAVYNVAAKDIGRRIRCKKCATGLLVTEAGLEVDDPTVSPGPAPAPAPPRAPAPADDFDDEPPRRERGRAPRRGLKLDPIQMFKDFGGVPSLLFGFGAFLVIVFLFQPIIGMAAISRAQGGSERIDLEWKTTQRKLEKDKKTAEEISTAREKFYKENDKDRADDNVGYEVVSNKRSKWFEMYGMMFGFLFLMAGSLGYMMPEQTTVRRILGTVVLGAQMLIIFLIFAAGGGGCGGAGGAAKGLG